MTLTREFAAPGFFWIGSCDGNKAGLLDANTCRLRLRSNEAVGAGYRRPTRFRRRSGRASLSWLPAEAR